MPMPGAEWGWSPVHTGCRHWSASDGPRTLGKRASDRSSRVALIYQHMTSDRDRAIADRLGAMIREGRGMSPVGGCGLIVD
ncbi:hypothetical protein F3K40_12930 [Streptomyces sp. LBUM 1478]|nr:hypothetical protein [Streptomyces sp. LBUM 1478]